MYSLTVLEALGSKSRCQQHHAPSEGSREDDSFASSQLVLVVASIPGRSLACHRLRPTPLAFSPGMFPVYPRHSLCLFSVYIPDWRSIS